ncbi:aromatic ring-hydroxylating dioxygenase subunit alpha [Streptomyces sp. ML-6]|uniref:aromatic ring-hydroxylating dioxygenase subunit alpha n=1 Tax=Streptomyces sp. ML-6 TaxID=2982693 RepID=UPI0024C0BCDA|nr:aromatic ring-hydroxylating dioxygenase subunit alpha [Streptomyces sp. ML-6]MDK0524230.1 aromatic ring-hydroxylating dioxygenase subunit alpha [Streptomyces sp. ML-6]
MLDIGKLVQPDKGLIHPSIYTDPEVYEAELEHVFARSWLFLAHDSQLPGPGSFIQTYMAEDPVLVVRQRDGSVKAFLNQCRHRGMRICRSDEGVARAFTCTYHGWAYNLAGELVNVPMQERAYHNEIDKSKWGPRRVPRVHNHKGFYFGTWDEDAPSFEEYLGDMAWQLDAMADRYDEGITLIPGATKWVIDCNWKFAAEQFGSDMYHVPSSHTSALVALIEDPQQLAQLHEMNLTVPGRQFSGNGHGSGFAVRPDIIPSQSGPEFDAWLDTHREEIHRRGGEQRALAANGHNTVFPNFSWLDINNTMRVWHPRGPGQIEVWAWTFVPKGAPEKVREEIRTSTIRSFSPAGVFETDDGENWTEIQQVLRGHMARKSLFNAQMGLGHEEQGVDGTSVRVTEDMYTEMAARGMYQRWADLMSGLSWQQIAELDRNRQQQEVHTA